MLSKLALYGTGATALLTLGVWLGRRSARKAEGGLGDGTGFASLDYTLAMPRLGALAAKQVTKAVAGSWIDDYRAAENASAFYTTPAYNVQAYYAAAYWTAVAARVLHNRSLAARAGSLQAKGSAMFGLPGSSFLTGSVVEIMADARRIIGAAGKGSPQIKGILGILGSAGEAKAVAGAQAREGDKGWVAAGAEKTAKDLWAPFAFAQKHPRIALAGLGALLALGGFAYWKLSGVPARLAASALQVRQKVAAQIAGPVAKAGATP